MALAPHQPTLRFRPRAFYKLLAISLLGMIVFYGVLVGATVGLNLVGGLLLRLQVGRGVGEAANALLLSGSLACVAFFLLSAKACFRLTWQDLFITSAVTGILVATSAYLTIVSLGILQCTTP